MSSKADPADNAISHLKNAEAELERSNLPSGERLANLVGLIREFVELDRDGELEAISGIFDKLGES